MKILYINHYAGSIYHGMEYRPYYLAREWVRAGHQVFIVASTYSHLRQKNICGKDDLIYANHSGDFKADSQHYGINNNVPLYISDNKNYLCEWIDGINYIWCKTNSYRGNGIGRFINIFNFLCKLYKIIDALVELKPDLVIASSTYPFDTWLVKNIARRSKAKFVYEVHDLWPLTLIELNGMSLWNPLIWLMQRAENYGYRHADKVVSLLPQAFNYMQDHGLTKDRFTVVSNGVTVDDWLQNLHQTSWAFSILQQQISTIKQQYRFLVGYAGGMGYANALTYLLDAASYSEMENVAFVLVGDGLLKPDLLDKVVQKALKNVFIFPPIIKSDVPHFLQLMDVLYIGWNQLPIYRFGISPNKLFDYMLSAKPIIHSVTAGNDLVADANCGISVPATNVLEIVEAITFLQRLDATQRKQIGENGYKYVINNCDYKYLASKFINEVFI